MKYLIIITLLLASCQPKEKDKLIVGKWVYDRMETYNAAEPLNLQDSMINQLHESQKGMTFYFTKINTFKVTQLKNNKEEVLAQQPYELAEDNKSVILKNTGRPDDNFPIIELSDSLLKINIFYSDKAYMVFKRSKE